MSAELRIVSTGIEMPEKKSGIEQFKAPEKSKDEYIRDFVKSIAAINEEIKVYRDQMKDLKKSYIDNGHLSKDEIKLAMQAYRLVKNKVDIDQLDAFFDKVNALKVVGDE